MGAVAGGFEGAEGAEGVYRVCAGAILEVCRGWIGYIDMLAPEHVCVRVGRLHSSHIRLVVGV